MVFKNPDCMVMLIFVQQSLITPVLLKILTSFIYHFNQYNILYKIQKFHYSRFNRTNFSIFDFFSIEVNVNRIKP